MTTLPVNILYIWLESTRHIANYELQQTWQRCRNYSMGSSLEKQFHQRTDTSSRLKRTWITLGSEKKLTLINAHALQAVGDHKEINKKRRKRATDDCHDDVSRVHQRTWTWQRRLKRKRRTEKLLKLMLRLQQTRTWGYRPPREREQIYISTGLLKPGGGWEKSQRMLTHWGTTCTSGRWRHPTHTHTLRSGN